MARDSDRIAALLIVNPRAGLVARSRAVRRVVAALEQLGWDVEVCETRARGDAEGAARDAAARGIDVVLTAGGDGTLNEAIQGLAGTDTAVGALPLGTMNVWVRELGLALDPVEAARQMAAGQVRRLDLGRVNGRYFLLMAGLGLDAEAILAVEGGPKRRFGPLAIVMAGVVAGARTTGSRLSLRVDDRPYRLQAAMLVAGNTRLWAGTVQITRRATASDGVLDVYVFPGRTLLDKLRHLALVLIGRHEHDPDVTYLRARELLIAARPPLPLQVDGEPHGTTPARIEAVPGARR
ncbi:MAG: diacylglycerol kinase family lipid kinase, partial [Chloroflexota bacterium]|nr:diacylglycerol kinase family lipid kinase [Chloroflexota bacterium]